MAESPDPLFDTSEPALSNRIERFKLRIAESPVDRACQKLTEAIHDLDSAVWLVGSPEACSEVIALAHESIERLATTITVAMARQEHHL